jgi:hypothetical protein
MLAVYMSTSGCVLSNAAIPSGAAIRKSPLDLKTRQAFDIN